MARLNDDEIRTEVEKDLRNRDENSIKNLSQFYYKILIEDKLSVRSFRYYYAKAALIIICEHTGDTETIANLNKFHIGKVAAESAMVNTVKDEDEEINSTKLARNRATLAERKAIPGRNLATQIEMPMVKKEGSTHYINEDEE